MENNFDFALAANARIGEPQRFRLTILGFRKKRIANLCPAIHERVRLSLQLHRRAVGIEQLGPIFLKQNVLRIWLRQFAP